MSRAAVSRAVSAQPVTSQAGRWSHENEPVFDLSPCPFCAMLAAPEPHRVVWRAGAVAVLTDIAPINQGHLLVVPVDHVPSLTALDPVVGGEMFAVAQRCAAALRASPFRGDGVSVRVVAGGEIGAAQYLQALAAGVEPDVRMNPVLVKPEGDDRSQVVVDGVVDHELSRTAWSERQRLLWPAIESALRSLFDEFELVVI